MNDPKVPPAVPTERAEVHPAAVHTEIAERHSLLVALQLLAICSMSEFRRCWFLYDTVCFRKLIITINRTNQEVWTKTCLAEDCCT